MYFLLLVFFVYSKVSRRSGRSWNNHPGVIAQRTSARAVRTKHGFNGKLKTDVISSSLEKHRSAWKRNCFVSLGHLRAKSARLCVDFFFVLWFRCEHAHMCGKSVQADGNFIHTKSTLCYIYSRRSCSYIEIFIKDGTVLCTYTYIERKASSTDRKCIRWFFLCGLLSALKMWVNKKSIYVRLGKFIFKWKITSRMCVFENCMNYMRRRHNILELCSTPALFVCSVQSQPIF